MRSRRTRAWTTGIALLTILQVCNSVTCSELLLGDTPALTEGNTIGFLQHLGATNLTAVDLGQDVASLFTTNAAPVQHQVGWRSAFPI